MKKYILRTVVLASIPFLIAGIHGIINNWEWVEVEHRATYILLVFIALGIWDIWDSIKKEKK